MSEVEQEAPEPSVGESELDVLITIRDLLTEIAAKMPTEPASRLKDTP